MATRAELHEKYGIYRLMKPDIANKELTQEEAEMYEKFPKLVESVSII